MTWLEMSNDQFVSSESKSVSYKFAATALDTKIMRALNTSCFFSPKNEVRPQLEIWSNKMINTYVFILSFRKQKENKISPILFP